MDTEQTNPITQTKNGTPRRRRPRSPQIVITVNPDRIDQAVRRDSRHCMIAEAIKEKIPEASTVTVDLQSIRYTDPIKRLRYIYLTPRVCQVALLDFDRGQKPEPFAFSLKHPYQITRHPSAIAQPARSKEERSVEKRKRIARRKEITAQGDELFKPPAEHTQDVVEAMKDPTQKLGSAILLDAPDGTKSAPIFVGGNPPRGPGNANLQRSRQFGLRLLVK